MPARTGRRTIPDPADSGAVPALTLTRIIDAPRAAVFNAWIDPTLVARWFGPGGVTAEIDRLEPRAGGVYRIRMRRPGGAESVVGGVYRELVPPERLVFTWTWERAAGLNAGRESIVTVTFAARGDRTEMTLRQELLIDAESRDSHRHGWTGSFEKLAALVAEQKAR
jgi:uncharacterized protein YndB with AHSA1/START domain